MSTIISRLLSLGSQPRLGRPNGSTLGVNRVSTQPRVANPHSGRWVTADWGSATVQSSIEYQQSAIIASFWLQPSTARETMLTRMAFVWRFAKWV